MREARTVLRLRRRLRRRFRRRGPRDDAERASGASDADDEAGAAEELARARRRRRQRQRRTGGGETDFTDALLLMTLWMLGIVAILKFSGMASLLREMLYPLLALVTIPVVAFIVIGSFRAAGATEGMFEGPAGGGGGAKDGSGAAAVKQKKRRRAR